MTSITPTRRKLQYAGNSSFVLTLPKTWVVNQGLDDPQARSEVLIQELSDSTLRIAPAQIGKSETKEDPYYINIRKDSDGNEVIRLILAAYLASRPQIILKAKDTDIIEPEIMFGVNDIVQKLWGAEITAETSSEIVIQDALDPSSMGIEDCIAKAWFTAQNMLDLTFKALFEGNEMAQKTVVNSENTLDKLYYLALRQLYKASSNYIFASDIGISPKDIIDYHLLSKNIERIGDHCVHLVDNMGKEFEHLDTLNELAELIKDSTDLAIKAFQSLDEEQAQLAINRRTDVVKMANSIEFTYNELPLSRSILRIADYCADIGELVINRIVSESQRSKPKK